MAANSDSKAVPAELDRFNWGAFFLAPVWAGVHGVWWAVVALLGPPLLVGGIVTALWMRGQVGDSVLIATRYVFRDVLFWIAAAVFARHANRLAWPVIRPTYDPEHFRVASRRWAWAGGLLAAVGYGFLVISIIYAGGVMP
jgi:hypothetical protein